LRKNLTLLSNAPDRPRAASTGLRKKLTFACDSTGSLRGKPVELSLSADAKERPTMDEVLVIFFSPFLVSLYKFYARIVPIL